MPDQGGFLKKKIVGPNLGQNWSKSGPKLGFFCFLKFGALVFPEIEHSDSLQQFLTSSRSKFHKKVLGVQIWAKDGPKLDFLPFSHIWLISFSLYCIG